MPKLKLTLTRRQLFSVTIWSLILAFEDQPPSLIVHKKSPWRWLRLVLAIAISLVLIMLVGGFIWYKQSLLPKDSHSSRKTHFTVAAGQTSEAIVAQLEKQGVIKSAMALNWYLRFEQPEKKLQAGRYALSVNQSAEAIANRLANGKTDLFMVTILPGSTLADIEKTLLKYGYSAQEINKALKAHYDHPLLGYRPAGQDLEGYIFPETYEMQSNASLNSLFYRDFDTLYEQIRTDGLYDQFKAHGLDVHQALTLASIVQKEASDPDSQRQVAQVFYSRLAKGMKLESDVTFMYAAKKLGVEPSVTLDSPYNTRLHGGLPPGPISNMEYSALLAVANPASTDFLYFVAGDNGTIYFSHTLEEHQANVQKYCHKLCE